MTYNDILDYGIGDLEVEDSVIEQLAQRCNDYKSLVEGLKRINEEQKKEIKELKDEHTHEFLELLSEMNDLKTIDYRNKYSRMREAVIQIINLVDTLKEEVKFDD